MQPPEIQISMFDLFLLLLFQGDTFERLQYSTENNLRASLGFLLANCPGTF